MFKQCREIITHYSLWVSSTYRFHPLFAFISEAQYYNSPRSARVTGLQMSYHLAFQLSTGRQREQLNFGTILIIQLPATYILYVCVCACVHTIARKCKGIFFLSLSHY